MFVRILSLIYLTTFVCGQSTNTCTSLKQCLDSANQCEQLKVSQTTISPPFTAKMLEAARKRLKLVNCPDASVTEILKNSAEGRVKTAQRQDRVARCIAGDISSFPGCPALPLPPANSLSRDCPNNIFKRQTRPAAAQCNKDQCRNYFCGCPEAHLCHECYELSQLHDEVHLIQLTHKLQLARCSGNVASRDGTIPDQEDSITYDFYVSLLGMKVLRHEEFQTGCEATCNGPYEGRWSKSMLGYGDESVHFVLELTYNYGVKSYQRGNDLVGIFIDNADAVKQVEQRRIGCRLPDGRLELSDPDGHKIFLSSNPSPIGPQLVKVALATDDMTKSVNFWQNLAKMTIYNQSDRATLMGYAGDQCKLELTSLPTGVSLTRGAAFGRIAFSAPEAELSEIQSVMRAESQTILTPLIILDTPGKASVTVVIVADPNGHEICYVGDEGFRQLSQPDPNANQLLLDAISQDFSDSGNKQ